jgi:hypothetical protein
MGRRSNRVLLRTILAAALCLAAVPETGSATSACAGVATSSHALSRSWNYCARTPLGGGVVAGQCDTVTNSTTVCYSSTVPIPSKTLPALPTLP